MGMPISSYTVLSALARDRGESYETEVAQRALRPFNLFAFIIHDYVADHGVADQVKPAGSRCRGKRNRRAVEIGCGEATALLMLRDGGSRRR